MSYDSIVYYNILKYSIVSCCTWVCAPPVYGMVRRHMSSWPTVDKSIDDDSGVCAKKLLRRRTIRKIGFWSTKSGAG